MCKYLQHFYINIWAKSKVLTLAQGKSLSLLWWIGSIFDLDSDPISNTNLEFFCSNNEWTFFRHIDKNINVTISIFPHFSDGDVDPVFLKLDPELIFKKTGFIYDKQTRIRPDPRHWQIFYTHTYSYSTYN